MEELAGKAIESLGVQHMRCAEHTLQGDFYFVKHLFLSCIFIFINQF